MQYLRKAIEKKKQYLIDLLINSGGEYQYSEPALQKLTLTELEVIFKKHKNGNSF
ncbi:Fur-regulated basic protein FbpA [Bacillus sp. ISL-47]|uniref:Fur-regulated basic protein FbpA n=1 Tax=Bacillus sp. ISL-47 TaxID=2819130 RepID=UPI001BE86BFC|nr:Fur-regulated basic protein FbpA [Bacillus sp. ISL-47]MBT2689289.1 Fur-regulated basic protein FbpA [Bacillus sp. ISL-47]MBT2707180.1 Fur-regulated basic protein FbpA [Pseudomonas sp. ISL-84]